jgi:hypothetical protein
LYRVPHQLAPFLVQHLGWLRPQESDLTFLKSPRPPQQASLAPLLAPSRCLSQGPLLALQQAARLVL